MECSTARIEQMKNPLTPHPSCWTWNTSSHLALLVKVKEAKASSAQDTLVVTTASLWTDGAIQPTASSPATNLLAKLPLGKQSTLRCAQTKLIGSTKAVDSKVSSDVQVTPRANAQQVGTSVSTAAVKSSRLVQAMRRVEAVGRS